MDYDVPCVRCAYNLRHLDHEARCPECGTPVLKSVDDWNGYQDRVWVKKVAGGAVCITLYVVTLSLVISFGSPLGRVLAGNYRSSWIVKHWLDPIIIIALSVIGCWLLTVRPNISDEVAWVRRIRFIARYASITGKFLFVLSLVVINEFDGWVPYNSAWIDLVKVALVSFTLWLMGTIALLMYTRILAAKASQARLACQFNYLLIGYIVAAVIWGMDGISFLRFHPNYVSPLFIYRPMVAPHPHLFWGYSFVWVWEILLMVWLSWRLCRKAFGQA